MTRPSMKVYSHIDAAISALSILMAHCIQHLGTRGYRHERTKTKKRESNEGVPPFQRDIAERDTEYDSNSYECLPLKLCASRGAGSEPPSALWTSAALDRLVTIR